MTDERRMWTALVRAVHDSTADADAAALAWADVLEEEYGGVPCHECRTGGRPGTVWSPDFSDGAATGDRFWEQCLRCRGAGWLPHPRAEFVRAQVRDAAAAPDPLCPDCRAPLVRQPMASCADLSRCPRCPTRTHGPFWADLEDPTRPGPLARELLEAHGPEWRRSGPCPKCAGTGWVGAPSDYPLGARQRCAACYGTGDTGGLAGCASDGKEHTRVRWRRGVPDLVVCSWGVVNRAPVCRGCSGTSLGAGGTCTGCAGSGWDEDLRPTRWAARVLAGHPTVRGFAASEWVPIVFESGAWGWAANARYRAATGTATFGCALPPNVYRALAGGTAAAPGVYRTYRTRHEALEAAAVAAGRLVRGALDGA